MGGKTSLYLSTRLEHVDSMWTAAKYAANEAAAKNKSQVCFCKDFIMGLTAAHTLQTLLHARFIWKA